jgi:hypothetical protein
VIAGGGAAERGVVESTPLVVLAVLAGLSLAALAASRIGLARGFLLTVVVIALAWAALDIREVVHQLDESRKAPRAPPASTPNSRSPSACSVPDSTWAAAPDAVASDAPPSLCAPAGSPRSPPVSAACAAAGSVWVSLLERSPITPTANKAVEATSSATSVQRNRLMTR